MVLGPIWNCIWVCNLVHPTKMVKSKFGTFWKISCNCGTIFYSFSIFSIIFCYKVCYLWNLHKNDCWDSTRKTYNFFNFLIRSGIDLKIDQNILIFFYIWKYLMIQSEKNRKNMCFSRTIAAIILMQVTQVADLVTKNYWENTKTVKNGPIITWYFSKCSKVRFYHLGWMHQVANSYAISNFT